MDKFFILLSLLSIPSIINVTWFEGLQSDFSNLVVELVTDNQTSYPQFQITQHEPQQWAEISLSLPESGYSLNFLASFQGTAPAPPNPEQPPEGQSLPNGTFNESSGSLITFFFNVTEGNISEQLGTSPPSQPPPAQEGQPPPPQTESPPNNATQNGTFIEMPENPPPQSNRTELNISHFSGLAPDFSNLLVQIVVGAVRADLPYSMLQLAPSQWALVSVEVPTDEPHTFEFFADFQNGSSQPNPLENFTQNGTSPADNSSNATNITIPPPEQQNITNYTLNATWFEGLKPDFSNLMVQFTTADNGSSNISYGILSLKPSQWALLLLERPPTDLEQVNLSAAEIQKRTLLHPQSGRLQVSLRRQHTSRVSLANGKNIDIENEALGTLDSGQPLRVIVKYGAGAPFQPTDGALRSLPSRGMEALEITSGDLEALADSGAEQILLDRQMGAALADTIPIIGADRVHSELGFTGSGVAICLLDTGVNDATEFGGKILPGFNFIANSSDTTDDNGHGTLMASVIHAVAPDASIIPVKVLGANAQGYSSDIIAGIDYCMQRAASDNVRILSMSFGGGNFTAYCDADAVAQAAQQAFDAGLLPVASTGNDHAEYITAPACGENVTAVASVDKSGTPSAFSNINAMADLLAPGEEVTIRGSSISGTSVSAAHVSGAAALLFQSNSSLSPLDAQGRMLLTGRMTQYRDIVYPRINIYSCIRGIITGRATNGGANRTNATGGYTYGAQATLISDCTNLNSAGTVYQLSASVNPPLTLGWNARNASCMNITVNSTLDCLGWSINGTNGTTTSVSTVPGSAVFINGTNGSTVTNCNITNWTVGIYVFNSNFISIQFNNISGSRYAGSAISLNGTAARTLTNISIWGVNISQRDPYGNTINITYTNNSSIYLSNITQNWSGLIGINASAISFMGPNSLFTIDTVNITTGEAAGINMGTQTDNITINNTNVSTGTIGIGVATARSALICWTGNHSITNSYFNTSMGTTGTGNALKMNPGCSNNWFENDTFFSGTGAAIAMFSVGNNTFKNITVNSTAGLGINMTSSNNSTFWLMSVSSTMVSGAGISIKQSSNNSFNQTTIVTPSNTASGINISGGSNWNNFSYINITARGTRAFGINTPMPSSKDGWTNGSLFRYVNITTLTGNAVYLGMVGGYNFTNNTFNGGLQAIYMGVVTINESAKNNIFVQNFFNSSSSVLLFIGNNSTNNTFYYNNFSTNNVSVNDSAINWGTGDVYLSANFYNTSIGGVPQGNIWPDVINGTEYIQGTSAVNFLPAGFFWGSGGRNYPYNNTTATAGVGLFGFTNVRGNVTDWGPVVPNALNCTVLSLPNANYTMTNNINVGATRPACFNITASNVSLNCSGYAIVGDNSTAIYGIFTNATNITIRDCNVSMFRNGYYLNNSINVTLINDTANITYYGAADPKGGSGVTVKSSNWTNVTNSTISALYLGIYVVNSSNASILNNTLQNGSLSHMISLNASTNNSVINNTISALRFYGIYIDNRANNNTLYNNTINASAGTGIYVSNSTYNTIRRNFVRTSTGTAINITGGANYTVVDENYVNSTSSIAFGTRVSSGCMISNNTFDGAGSNVMILDNASINNSIVNNTFFSRSNNVYSLVNVTRHAGNNTFWWNNFTNITGYLVIDANGSNFYNTTIGGKPIGNQWGDVINGTTHILGDPVSPRASPWGDLFYGAIGPGYPYGRNNSWATSAGKVAGQESTVLVGPNITDYGPLTKNALACGILNVSNATYLMNSNIDFTITQGSIGTSCFNVTNANITLNCTGFDVLGDNSTTLYGVASNASNTSIYGCNMTNFTYGYFLNGTSTAILFNNTANVTGSTGAGVYMRMTNKTYLANTTVFFRYIGIHIWNDTNSTLIDNVVLPVSNSYFGTNFSLVIRQGRNMTIGNNTFNGTNGSIAITSEFIYEKSFNNTFINNTLLSEYGTLLFINNSSFNNTFYYNNFSSTKGLYVNDSNKSNFYNITANGWGLGGAPRGNIWADVINGSVYITGSEAVSFLPAGFFWGDGTYRYNTTSSSKISGNVTDSGPVTQNVYGACGRLNNENGNYLMTSDISTTSTVCFNITASNITLNCSGYNINGDNSTTIYGVYSMAHNTTIINCNVTNFQYGYFLNATTNATLWNNSANTTWTSGAGGAGVYMRGANYTLLDNTTIWFKYIGIHMLELKNATLIDNVVLPATSPASGLNFSLVLRSVINSTIGNNTFNGTNGSITITSEIIRERSYNNTFINNTLLSAAGTLLFINNSSFNNTFYYNNFTYTTGQFVNDTNRSNYYNITSNGWGLGGYPQGNIWFDVINGSTHITGFTNPVSFMPGFFWGNAGPNYPYNSSNSLDQRVFRNVTDWGPITLNNLACGILNVSGGNYTMDANLATTGASCFNITGSNLTLSCAGFTITGNNATGTYGVMVNSTNVTVRDCRILEYQYGIYYNGTNAANGSVINNSVSLTSTAGTGIFMNGSMHNITNNTVVATWNVSLAIWSGQNSTIANNSFTGGNVSIWLEVNATNNTFINNSLSSTAGTLLYIGADSANNTFYWNNFTATTGLYVNDSPKGPKVNFYNYTNFTSASPIGNIWANVINGSVQVYGPMPSAFPNLYYGNAGTGYPYSNTTALGKLAGNVTDNGPITNYSSQPVVTSTCQNITANYTLINNVTSTGGTCFNLNANGIMLNCSGFTIIGVNATNSTGIFSGYNNVIVRDCKIEGFTYGLEYLNNLRGVVLNTSAFSNTLHGFYFNGSSNGNMTNLSSLDNLGDGVLFENNAGTGDPATGNNLTGIEVKSFGSGHGIYSSSATNSLSCGGLNISGVWVGSACFQDSSNVPPGCGATGIGSYACEGSWDGAQPCTNAYDADWSTYGQYDPLATLGFSTIFMNYTAPIAATSSSVWQAQTGTGGTPNFNSTFSGPTAGCFDAGNLLQLRIMSSTDNNTAFGDCWDYTAAAWVPVFSDGSGTQVYEDGMWWDMQPYGVYSSGANSNITSCNISNFVYGAVFSSASGNKATNIRAHDSWTFGIFASSSTGGTIYNSSAVSTGGASGIVAASSTNTNITNSTGISVDGRGIWVDSGSSGSNVTQSVGTSSSQPGIQLDTLSNLTNSTGISSGSYGILAAGAASVLDHATGTSSSSAGIQINAAATVRYSSGTSTSGNGIYSQASFSNVTSSNATSASNDAILLSNSLNSTVANVTANSTGGGYGIKLTSSTGCILANSTFDGASTGAINLDSASGNTTVSNNTLYSSTSAGIVGASSANYVYSNTVRAAANGIQFTSTSNNTISSNNITKVGTGSNGIYLLTTSNSSVVNNSFNISSSGGTVAIKLDTRANGNNISGNLINGSHLGIGLYATSLNNTISSNFINASRYPVYLSASSRNLFANNTMNSTGGNVSFYLDSGSSNNTVVNNTLASPNYTLLFIAATAGNNTFWWNNFTNTSGLYVNDTNHTNFYNTTNGTSGTGIGIGNIWHNVINLSIFIEGAYPAFPDFKADTFYYGSQGNGYPYNNTTSQEGTAFKLAGNVTDYGPVTPTLASTCRNLTANYTLATNVTSTGGICFSLNKNNITLNCNGFTIRGANNSGSIAAYTSNNSTKIENCNITMFSEAIRINNGQWAVLYNNTLNITFANGNATHIMNGSNATNMSYNHVYVGLANATYIETQSENTTIDCLGQNITGLNYTSTFGVFSTQSRTTVQNCSIINFDTGVVLVFGNGSAVLATNVSPARIGYSVQSAATGVSFAGASAAGATNGLILQGTGNSTFFRLNFSNISSTAIWITNTSVNNSFYNLTSQTQSANGNGVRFDIRSDNNTIDCNGGVLLGSNLTASIPAGVGIYLIDAQNNTMQGCTVWNYSMGFELTTSASTINNTVIRNNTVLSTFDSSSLWCLDYIRGRNGMIVNNTLNCTNSEAVRIRNLGASPPPNLSFINNTVYSYLLSGVLIQGSSNVTFAGNYINASVNGIYEGTTGSNNMTVYNNTINAFSTAALSFITDSNGTISENIINATGSNATGIKLATGSSGFNISNNTFFASGGAEVFITTTSGNSTFYWNNFTGTPGAYVYDTNGSNWYNTSNGTIPQGNIWLNVINGTVDISSVTQYPTPLSGFFYGDSGTGWPYNNSSTTAAKNKLIGNITDWGPFTSQGAGCRNLTANFTMTSSVASTGGTCFSINAANITLNCSGYSIKGANTSDSTGVFSGNYATTVRDCNIANFSEAIRLTHSTDSWLYNNTLNTSFTGGNSSHIMNGSNRTNMTLNYIWGGGANGIAIDSMSRNVSVNCSGLNITGNNFTGTYGIASSAVNTTVTNCTILGFDYGLYFANSSDNGTVQFSNITLNLNGGLRYVNSSNNTLTNTTICGNPMDIDNAGLNNGGALGTYNSCDSFLNYSENSHSGCTYSCTVLWHRFFGNVTGQIVLGDAAAYAYAWNSSSGLNVYASQYNAAVNWSTLQAIGRTTGGTASANDFTELDSAFSSAAYSDSIKTKYASDASTPVYLDLYKIYGRSVDNVPVYNSSNFNTSFKTGILWDMNGGGAEYNGSQSTVWVAKVNASTDANGVPRNDTYGNYHYLIEIPYTLSTYQGTNSLVSFYAELQ